METNNGKEIIVKGHISQSSPGKLWASVGKTPPDLAALGKSKG